MKINNIEVSDENIKKLFDFWWDRCTNICDCCQNFDEKLFNCDDTCEYYEEYSEENPAPEEYNYTKVRSCQDLDFGTCKAFEGKICKECNASTRMKDFSWNGKIICNKWD